MRIALILLVALGAIPQANAADITAGEKKALACAACHGHNGVSVSANFPNLAGQRAKYLSTQLKAFRDGKRQNPLMNAIAAQLDDTDIENLAAFFNSLPGATGSGMSEMPAAVSKTRVRFPLDYKTHFTLYTTINFPKKKQVRNYYANDEALKAAREGQPLPDGSVLFVEIFKAKLDDGNNPVEGSDGFFVADKLAAFTAMEKHSGWGKDIPDILRNGDWNYAVFTADKALKKGVNQAICLACHKPLTDDSYVFSLTQLQEKARMQQSGSAAWAEGDAAAGEKVFKKCKACHTLEEGGKHRVGPNFWGVFGRQAGTAEGYTKYSKDMIAAGEVGLVWSEETIASYIKKDGGTKAFIGSFIGKKKAKTKMAFRGLKKDEDVANLVAYLKANAQ